MEGLRWWEAMVVPIFVFCCMSCYYYGCEGRCTPAQRGALLELLRSMNSPDGSALPGWAGRDCCAWVGITCDDAGSSIVSVRLGMVRNASGPWYPNATLFSLIGAHLEELDLGLNNIYGWVMPEDFCKLKKLKQLVLNDNSISGGIDPCLCNMPSLTKLDLSSNKLRGNISDCLCGLRSLAKLDLSNNTLQGNVPQCLGGMGSLEELDLSRNKLQGHLPPSLFTNLTSINKLYISYNSFDGVLPFSTLANLSNLHDVDLSYNYHLEVETESPSWVPSFQLGYLYITGCVVNKRSRHVLPSFLPSQTSLKTLELSNDSIAGTLPSWMLYNSSLSYVTLGDNKFTGEFPLPPHPNTTSSAASLDLSNNDISGMLPPDMGLLFPHLVQVYMGGNRLQGGIPPSLGTLPDLNILSLPDNDLSGAIPPSFTQNSTNLKILILTNNRLGGEMLPADMYMPSLKCLQLGGNAFSGVMSPGLSNSSALKVLDVGNNSLRGPIPSGLPSRLRVILLSGNDFQGTIPNQLCQMPQVQIYDVADNQISGKIPSCIENVTSWKKGFVPDETDGLQAWGWGHAVTVVISTKNVLYPFHGEPISTMFSIDMSSNRLVGVIPPELGELTGVRSLNLSGNLLSGPLPRTLGGIRNLESLDLSHNEFIGPIPIEIEHLSYLNTLNVAYNNLSGEIPTGGQFFSFNGSSYVGNPGLCGRPLSRNCSTENARQSQVGGRKRHRIDRESLIFHSVVVVSFTLGFWGVLAFLFLQEGRRVRYLRAVDAHLDAMVEKLHRRRRCR